MKTAISTEVSLYHPIEFLELDKLTKAFFDISLEKLKGGVRNHLLVGHIVHFVQDNGLQGFESLPRFRKEYLYELVEKTSAKGIDLTTISEQNLNLNWDKVKSLSQFNQVYRPNDAFDQAANIYSSSNYKMFRFLEFNRDIDIKHVNRLIISMRRNNIISYPLMIYTDCVDGKWGYWIVDGQHRFEAMKRLGIPIWFTLYEKQSVEPITLYDLVRLVADVNNTSKPWGIHQYLKAWKSLGVREYLKIDEEHRKIGLPITVLLQAYSGLARNKATRLFIQGKYSMGDEERGTEYVSYLNILKPHVPRSSWFYSTLLEFFRATPDYDNEQMEKGIRNADAKFLMTSNGDDLMVNLKAIYEEAA